MLENRSSKIRFSYPFPKKRSLTDCEPQKSGYGFDLRNPPIARVWILWIHDLFLDLPPKTNNPFLEFPKMTHPADRKGRHLMSSSTFLSFLTKIDNKSKGLKLVFCTIKYACIVTRCRHHRVVFDSSLNNNNNNNNTLFHPKYTRNKNL